MAAWTRTETYNAELGSPVAWLVRIARNRFLNADLRAAAITSLAVCTVNFGRDGIPYAKVWAAMEKQVEPEVWAKQSRVGISDRGQRP